MKYRLLLTFSIVALTATVASAQGRVLSILEHPADVRSAALGGAALGDTKQMHIYSNPAAAVFSDDRLNISLSSNIFPTTDAGRTMQFNLGSSIELHPNRSLLVGARWKGGQEISTTISNDEVGVIRPYEWTADLGYAFRVIPEVVAYATATYFQSDMGRKTNGVGFSAGFGFQKLLKLNQTSTLLTLGLRLQDVGKPIKYGDTGVPYSMPTSIQAGGDWQIALSQKHQIAYALSARYFTPKDAQLLLISTGLEYSFNNLIAARLGYRYGQNELSQLTCGIGGHFKGFRADVSYLHGLAKNTGLSTVLVGVGYSF